MESKAKYTLVGTLVILICVGIVCMVLWLSEVGGMHDSKSYSIYFQNHSLYGLQVNSMVTMRGIKVGIVKSLEISPKNIEQIHVVVVLDKQAPVKVDTVAVINRNLLTGFASIDLPRGTSGAPLREAVSDGEIYPVIPEGNSELEEITSSIPDLVEKVSTLTARVESLISEENVGAVTSSLKNIQEVTETLANSKGDLANALKRISVAADEFGKVSQSLNEFTSKNNGRLVEVSDELVETMKEIRKTMSSVREQSTTLFSSVTGTSQVLTEQISALSQNISEAAQKIAATLERYEQPRKILTGPSKDALGPGEGAFK